MLQYAIRPALPQDQKDLEKLIATSARALSRDDYEAIKNVY